MKKTQFCNLFVLTLFFAMACGSACGGGTTEADNESVATEKPDISEPAQKADEPTEDDAVAGSEASKKCESDADCVPSQCCHAPACVAKADAPNCEDIMCSDDCQEGTMDCGAGSCACVEGVCEVKWKERAPSEKAEGPKPE